jgi:hypothetical protein
MSDWTGKSLTRSYLMMGRGDSMIRTLEIPSDSGFHHSIEFLMIPFYNLLHGNGPVARI